MIKFFKNNCKNLNPWQRQDFQRNFLSHGIKSADTDDIIIFSDADEIPNLSIFNEDYQVRAVALDRLTNAQESLRQHSEVHQLIEIVKDFSSENIIVREGFLQDTITVE